MKKLYWTQRYERIGSVNLWDKSLNWTYTASFYLNGQFADWNKAGLTNVIDQQISEDNYTAEIYPWIKKLTRFVECEYNEEFVDPTELTRSLENVGRRFDIAIFETKEEAIAWIKENTNLVEEETGKFLIAEANEDLWEIIPAKYLNIA